MLVGKMNKKTIFIAFLALFFASSCFAGDTLWSTAKRMRPNHQVSVQQTMLDLMKSNPRAFLCNNINSFRDGYRLHLPSIDKIKKISKDRAFAIVDAQNSAWEKSPKKACLIAKHKKTRRIHQITKTSLTPVEKPGVNQVVEAEVTPSPQTSKILETVVNQDKKIDTVSQSVQDLQKNTDSKLFELSQTNAALQTEVTKITADVTVIKKEVVDLKKRGHFGIMVFFKELKKDLGPIGLAGAGGLILVLLVVLLKFKCMFSRSTCKRVQPLLHNPDLEESDYDFLGSKEGIAAKLDLARMYSDMGDKTKAAALLDEISEKGTKEQQLAAETLRAKLTDIK